jgi:hypothetical protein
VVALGALVALIIIISAVSAGSGGGGGKNESNSPSPPPSSTLSTHKNKKNSTDSLNAQAGALNRVRAGSAFTLGDFRILRGWRVHKVGFGLGYEVKGLVVKNITGESHAFSADIKLHKGAHRIIADMTCIANEANPGDVVSVDCLPDGSGKPYDYITIENSF